MTSGNKARIIEITGVWFFMDAAVWGPTPASGNRNTVAQLMVLWYGERDVAFVAATERSSTSAIADAEQGGLIINKLDFDDFPGSFF